MLKDSADSIRRHQRFICEVVSSEVVWALKSAEGYVSSEANNYTNEDGDGANLIFFWSDVKTARVCAKKYWPDYQPVPLSLNEFMENWCAGMHGDGAIAGTNFDWNLFGYEAPPLALLVELFDQLNMVDKILDFKKYKNFAE